MPRASRAKSSGKRPATSMAPAAGLLSPPPSQPLPTDSTSRHDRTYPPKRRISRPGFLSPPTPEPPRPPAKSTSPRSRLFTRTRSPPRSVIRNPDEEHTSHAALRSPHYDPTRTDSYFDQCFENIELLGRGSYGEVYKVRSRDDGKLYAVKRSTRKFTSRGDRERRLEEVRSGRGLGQHPFCLEYLEAWEEDELLYIQMELCSEGSLKDHALSNNIAEDELWRILSHILIGLRHIHANGFLHLDIKPANIFMAQDLTVKIGDFGIAQRFRRIQGAGDGSDGSGETVLGIEVDEFEDGDPVYMAPELLNPEQVKSVSFGPPADIFSSGMTMLDMASGREIPGYGDGWHELRSDKIPRELFGDTSDEFVELVTSMIASDPRQRPTLDVILKHAKISPFLRSYEMYRVMNIPAQMVGTCFAHVLERFAYAWRRGVALVWDDPDESGGSGGGGGGAGGGGSGGGGGGGGGGSGDIGNAAASSLTLAQRGGNAPDGSRGIAESIPGKTKLFIGSSDEEDAGEGATGTQTRLFFDSDDESPSKRKTTSMNLRRRLARDEEPNPSPSPQSQTQSRTRNLAQAFDDV